MRRGYRIEVLPVAVFNGAAGALDVGSAQRAQRLFGAAGLVLIFYCHGHHHAPMPFGRVLAVLGIVFHGPHARRRIADVGSDKGAHHGTQRASPRGGGGAPCRAPRAAARGTNGNAGRRVFSAFGIEVIAANRISVMPPGWIEIEAGDMVLHETRIGQGAHRMF